ncbi:hypothetical protein CANINC_002706 [Pichia inconspicua]|uniref:Uncharacterized protein n=1 Tax=Pichia inconspicua TaxID=52247 RepID=A0A4T0X0U1_9ASCO|nr:hypothetical protein CANINC_002706 [[Candida] inconspicua]
METSLIALPNATMFKKVIVICVSVTSKVKQRYCLRVGVLNMFVTETDAVSNKNFEILKETHKALKRCTAQITSNPQKRREVSRLRITSPTPTYDVISSSVRTSGASSHVELEGEEHTQEEGSHTDDYQSLNVSTENTDGSEPLINHNETIDFLDSDAISSIASNIHRNVSDESDNCENSEESTKSTEIDDTDSEGNS